MPSSHRTGLGLAPDGAVVSQGCKRISVQRTWKNAVLERARIHRYFNVKKRERETHTERETERETHTQRASCLGRWTSVHLPLACISTECTMITHTLSDCTILFTAQYLADCTMLTPVPLCWRGEGGWRPCNRMSDVITIEAAITSA